MTRLEPSRPDPVARDTNDHLPSSDALTAYRKRWTQWLTVPIYIGCSLAFLSDLFLEVFMLFGLFYLPLICTAVFHHDPRWTWRLAWIAAAASAIGFFFPIINPDTTIAVVNRALSIAALFITAALVHHARLIQDRLAEQTQRAEAAERLKTEVFTTLSTQLRQPLQGLAALAGVMTADCRPDQKAPLARVQESSQRLAQTLDNLIDLLQLGGQPLQRETVDINQVLSETVASLRPLAEFRQVRIIVDQPAAERHLATGDPWAIRRIIENLLANSLRFSPTGSVVEIVAEASDHGTTITIRDSGQGIPVTVLNRLTTPVRRAESSLSSYAAGVGAGLALCRGLAGAMGAELRFDSQIGDGTTVTLLLPC